MSCTSSVLKIRNLNNESDLKASHLRINLKVQEFGLPDMMQLETEEYLGRGTGPFNSPKLVAIQSNGGRLRKDADGHKCTAFPSSTPESIVTCRIQPNSRPVILIAYLVL